MKRAFFVVSLFLPFLALACLAATVGIKLFPSQPSQPALSVLPVAFSFGDKAAEGSAALGPNKTSPLTPTGSGFTYQGRLTNGGNPASGSYDFVFTLFDTSSGGNQVGSPPVITATNQTVTNGLFTVSLDFGSSAFDGNARYLELAVRASGGGSYTTLSPRQPITPAPYALFALKTQPYKNIVVVAKSGGDFTSVQSALNAITDNSATNRYLVHVAPGTYTETVAMKQYVDIEGSGEDNTKITFTGSTNPNTGTILGAGNGELRFLAVENTGGNTYAVGIFNNGASLSLVHVTVSVSGATTTDYGVNNIALSSPSMVDTTVTTSSAATYNLGVYNSNSSPSMINVTATATGASYNYGLFNDGTSSPKIVTSLLSASGGSGSYGVYNNGNYTVTIDDSKIAGGSNSILNGYPTTTRVGASQLSGGPVSNAGTLMCSASYDGNNKRLGADCTHNTKVAVVGLTDGDYTSITAALSDVATWCGTPSAANKCLVKVGPGTYTERVTMVPYVDIEGAGEDATKITFTGSTSQYTASVNGASNTELRYLTVESTGGDYPTAIYNGSASPSLLHVTATAFGGSSQNFGVYNDHSAPNMTNVTAIASGPAVYPSMGIYNTSSSARIVASLVSANGNGGGAIGVFFDGGSTVTIDNSKIASSDIAISNRPGCTTRVGASQLSGTVDNSGTLVCVASYSGAYAALNSTCH